MIELSLEGGVTMADVKPRPTTKTVKANIRKGIIDDSRVEGEVYDLDELTRRFSSTPTDEPVQETLEVDQPHRRPVH